MADSTDRAEGLGKLWPMIRNIRVAMLTTWDGDHLRSRPMHAHIDEATGELCFFTRLDSGKTREARRYDEVNVAFADNSGKTWVSVSGRARIDLAHWLARQSDDSAARDALAPALGWSADVDIAERAVVAQLGARLGG